MVGAGFLVAPHLGVDITEQVPNERIIWRSTGNKGYVEGAVTFHELAPDLTRIILVLEYHPKGLFERTGNLWRAQGRRARLELKHFQRRTMTRTLLHPDEVEGWEGEIHDGKVVSSNGSREAQDEESSTENPVRRPRAAIRAGPARAATSSRRSATKSSGNLSGARRASQSTSSGRKQPAKAGNSSRGRSQARKRS